MDTLKKPPTRADAYVRSGIEPLIDTEEAAALLQIHPRTLQRMARRGEVRGYQLGKLWRFRASDLLGNFSAMPFKLVS
jgi:excisionase family DNA binding protein